MFADADREPGLMETGSMKQAEDGLGMVSVSEASR